MGTRILQTGSHRDTRSGPITYGNAAVLITTKSAVVKTAQHASRRLHPNIFVPPTAFSATTDQYKCARVRFGADAFNTGWDEFTYPGPVGIKDTALIASMRNRAIIRCLNQLKNQNVNYAQAFAERAQTAGLVANAAKKIAAAALDLRRGRFIKAAARFGVVPSGRSIKKFEKQGDQLAQSWLELQYGWKPLLSDVYGATKDLADRDANSANRYRITVKASIKAKTASHSGMPATGYTGPLLAEYGVYTRLDYHVDNPAMADLASTGILNPAVLAWELLPWSFVADWFVPIGSYLNAFDAAVGYAFDGGSSTSNWKYNFTGNIYRTGYHESGTTYPYWYGLGIRRDTKHVDRIVYSSSPMPRFPGFKNPFSLTHLANSIALLVGTFKK